MAICKFSASYIVILFNVLDKFMMTVLPFLASITLIFCSKSLYVFVVEGHHVDEHTVLLRMMQCAAFVVPASVYLFQTVGYGPVLFIGACFTTLGITTPSLFAEIRKQEVSIAVLYGAGVSIMFQATFTAAVSMFSRSNIIVLLLGPSAIIMGITQKVFQMATVKLSMHILLGILVLIPVLCIFPAFIDVIRSRRSETNKNYVELTDSMLHQETSKDLGYSIHEELLKNSMITEKVSSCVTDKSGIHNKTADSVNWGKSDLKWRLIAILWWSIGIHLSCLSSTIKEPTINHRILQLVYLLSLITLAVKILLTRKKSADISSSNSDNSAGFFVISILGISGLIVQFYPLIIDIHCCSLLFSMSFFHQLKLTNGCNSVSKTFRDLGYLINQISVELILTFCALAIGYQLTNIIYYSAVTQIISSNLFSDIGLTVISSMMLLVSMGYCIKKVLTCQSTTVDQEWNEQI